MSIYSVLGLRTRWQKQLPFRNTIYPFLGLFLAIHALWMFYDTTITSYEHHRPKRKDIQITESSPLSPFYSPGQQYDGFTRAFPVWNNPFPCGLLEDEYHMRTRAAAKEGILYVKQVEASTTIFSSVTANIARSKGKQQTQAQNNSTANVCTTRLTSQRAMRYRDRVPEKSFLWSVVREPVSRLVSKYYHYGEVKKKSGTYTTMLSRFQNFIFNLEAQDYGYYFRSLAVNRRMNPGQKEHERDTRELLESYDFLGVSERMDESLAVLKIILNLGFQDVLYLPIPKAKDIKAKLADGSDGGFVDYYDRWSKDKCRPILKPEVPLEMKEWFYSEEFEAFIEADVMFYKAVNASLDKTISELGRDLVEKTVKQVQWAQKVAEKECQNARFPCSSQGEIQKETDCLFSNVGCGYKCLDEVGTKLLHDPEFQALF